MIMALYVDSVAFLSYCCFMLTPKSQPIASYDTFPFDLDDIYSLPTGLSTILQAFELTSLMSRYRLDLSTSSEWIAGRRAREPMALRVVWGAPSTITLVDASVSAFSDTQQSNGSNASSSSSVPPISLAPSSLSLAPIPPLEALSLLSYLPQSLIRSAPSLAAIAAVPKLQLSTANVADNPLTTTITTTSATSTTSTSQQQQQQHQQQQLAQISSAAASLSTLNYLTPPSYGGPVSATLGFVPGRRLPSIMVAICAPSSSSTESHAAAATAITLASTSTPPLPSSAINSPVSSSSSSSSSSSTSSAGFVPGSARPSTSSSSSSAAAAAAAAAANLAVANALAAANAAAAQRALSTVPLVVAHEESGRHIMFRLSLHPPRLDDKERKKRLAALAKVQEKPAGGGGGGGGGGANAALNAGALSLGGAGTTVAGLAGLANTGVLGGGAGGAGGTGGGSNVGMHPSLPPLPPSTVNTASASSSLAAAAAALESNASLESELDAIVSAEDKRVLSFCTCLRQPIAVIRAALLNICAQLLFERELSPYECTSAAVAGSRGADSDRMAAATSADWNLILMHANSAAAKAWTGITNATGSDANAALGTVGGFGSATSDTNASSGGMNRSSSGSNITLADALFANSTTGHSRFERNLLGGATIPARRLLTLICNDVTLRSLVGDRPLLSFYVVQRLLQQVLNTELRAANLRRQIEEASAMARGSENNGVANDGLMVPSAHRLPSLSGILDEIHGSNSSGTFISNTDASSSTDQPPKVSRATSHSNRSSMSLTSSSTSTASTASTASTVSTRGSRKSLLPSASTSSLTNSPAVGVSSLSGTGTFTSLNNNNNNNNNNHNSSVNDREGNTPASSAGGAGSAAVPPVLDVTEVPEPRVNVLSFLSAFLFEYRLLRLFMLSPDARMLEPPARLMPLKPSTTLVLNRSTSSSSLLSSWLHHPEQDQHHQQVPGSGSGSGHLSHTANTFGRGSPSMNTRGMGDVGGVQATPSFSAPTATPMITSSPSTTMLGAFGAAATGANAGSSSATSSFSAASAAAAAKAKEAQVQALLASAPVPQSLGSLLLRDVLEAIFASKELLAELECAVPRVHLLYTSILEMTGRLDERVGPHSILESLDVAAQLDGNSDALTQQVYYDTNTTLSSSSISRTASSSGGNAGAGAGASSPLPSSFHSWLTTARMGQNADIIGQFVSFVQQILSPKNASSSSVTLSSSSSSADMLSPLLSGHPYARFAASFSTPASGGLVSTGPMASPALASRRPLGGLLSASSARRSSLEASGAAVGAGNVAGGSISGSMPAPSTINASAFSSSLSGSSNRYQLPSASNSISGHGSALSTGSDGAGRRSSVSAGGSGGDGSSSALEIFKKHSAIEQAFEAQVATDTYTCTGACSRWCAYATSPLSLWALQPFLQPASNAPTHSAAMAAASLATGVATASVLEPASPSFSFFTGLDPSLSPLLSEIPVARYVRAHHIAWPGRDIIRVSRRGLAFPSTLSDELASPYPSTSPSLLTTSLPVSALTALHTPFGPPCIPPPSSSLSQSSSSSSSSSSFSLMAPPSLTADPGMLGDHVAMPGNRPGCRAPAILATAAVPFARTRLDVLPVASLPVLLSGASASGSQGDLMVSDVTPSVEPKENLLQYLQECDAKAKKQSSIATVAEQGADTTGRGLATAFSHSSDMLSDPVPPRLFSTAPYYVGVTILQPEKDQPAGKEGKEGKGEGRRGGTNATSSAQSLSNNPTGGSSGLGATSQLGGAGAGPNLLSLGLSSSRK